MSAIPGETIRSAGLGKESYHVDGHFLMFFLLCASYYKATKNVIISIVLSILYGLTDEFHQLYVPMRSFQTKDLLVDTLGALLAGGVLWKLQFILPTKLKNWLNS